MPSITFWQNVIMVASIVKILLLIKKNKESQRNIAVYSRYEIFLEEKPFVGRLGRGVKLMCVDINKIT